MNMYLLDKNKMELDGIFGDKVHIARWGDRSVKIDGRSYMTYVTGNWKWWLDANDYLNVTYTISRTGNPNQPAKSFISGATKYIRTLNDKLSMYKLVLPFVIHQQPISNVDGNTLKIELKVRLQVIDGKLPLTYLRTLSQLGDDLKALVHQLSLIHI